MDVALIEFSEGPNSPSTAYLPKVEANHTRLLKAMQGRGTIRKFQLALHAGDDRRRISAQNALRLFNDLSELGDYTDIILDVSAAPRGIYLPLAAKILHLVEPEEGKPIVNFHVMVAEDSSFDAHIHDEGVEERADFIYPFKGAMDREATAGLPRVWMPLLGENQRIQLERIYELIQPDEICPVLPSPARDPRRGDKLVQAYHGLLFDNWRIEPRNFIYGSERNPFEVYRQLTRAIVAYRESFAPLDGAKFVLSAVSSKLLSIAALLVAYDFRANDIEIGIAHVDCHGYKVDPEAPVNSELSGLWLTGEWEASPAGAVAAPEGNKLESKATNIETAAK
ncbi:hypothetical protein [Opitutus terrae]|uniref:hypothetical protein n=1 Tax=Opitutus terrae TaxID=107709 RepID=UPI0011D0E981|nr:hypothetical protein [Opitutus terrae]